MATFLREFEEYEINVDLDEGMLALPRCKGGNGKLRPTNLKTNLATKDACDPNGSGAIETFEDFVDLLEDKVTGLLDEILPINVTVARTTKTMIDLVIGFLTEAVIGEFSACGKTNCRHRIAHAERDLQHHPRHRDLAAVAARLLLPSAGRDDVHI